MICTILWEVIFIVFAITVVVMATKRTVVPSLNRIDDPAARTPPQPESGFEHDLHALDFRFAGEYEATMIETIPTKLRMYLAPDGLCAACVIDMTSGAGRVRVLEFSTEFTPRASITTSTSSQPSVFTYPPGKMVAKVPWKKAAAEVLELHRALVKVATDQHFRVNAPPPDIAGTVREHTRTDCEYQVMKKKLKKVAPDQYKITLFGAILATPVVWYQMCYGPLFSWYKPGNEAFCGRYRRILSKACHS